MSETYGVWLPFTLPSLQGIEVAEPPRHGTLSGFQATLLKEATCYALEVSGIPSAEDAGAFLKRFEAGLLWAATMSRFGVRLSHEAPQRIKKHGRMHADKPAIYKGARPAFRVSLRGTLSGLRQPEPFLEWIGEGAALPCAEGLAGDAKLSLALDLYCLSHFEATQASQFLTLCTALEAVAPPLAPDRELAEHVKRWVRETLALAEAAEPGSEARQRLGDFAGRVGGLKEASHTQRIQTYVRNTLRADGDPEADAIAKDVAKLYSDRGRLMHSGRLPQVDAPSRLDEIMAKVLKAALRRKGR